MEASETLPPKGVFAMGVILGVVIISAIFTWGHGNDSTLQACVDYNLTDDSSDNVFLCHDIATFSSKKQCKVFAGRYPKAMPEGFFTVCQ